MARAILTGGVLGFLVAAQVGPIWLLCARSALRYGTLVGLAIGAGAAVIDLTYAALGVAGVARLVEVSWLRPVLGTIGACVLAWIGGRTLWTAWRVRAGAETDDEVAAPAAAFRTALAATASNPLTIASWAAAFAAASTANLVSGTAKAAALVGAVGVGSLTWFAVLSVACGLLGRRATPRALRAVDTVSGLTIIGFGGVLGMRAVRG
jgi:threonine/homoserine/homoserine lactone efflux protein